MQLCSVFYKKEFRYMYEGHSSHEVTRQFTRFAFCVFDTFKLISFHLQTTNILISLWYVQSTLNSRKFKNMPMISRWEFQLNHRYSQLTQTFVGNERHTSEAAKYILHLNCRHTRLNFYFLFSHRKTFFTVRSTKYKKCMVFFFFFKIMKHVERCVYFSCGIYQQHELRADRDRQQKTNVQFVLGMFFVGCELIIHQMKNVTAMIWYQILVEPSKRKFINRARNVSNGMIRWSSGCSLFTCVLD